MEVEHGIAGRLPYLATGAGAPIVFLGGLSPEAGVESQTMQRMNLAAIAPFAGSRRVLFFNRRRGLPEGMTISELAAEHAEAIGTLPGGSADVIGLSTGGSIAQQLAAEHPEVVRRLALISSACRLGAAGRLLQRRVAARVRRGANRQAFAVFAAGLVPPRRGKLVAAAAAWLIGPRLFGDAEALADMATTIEAEDEFDLARCHDPIRAPTLIVAGSEDRFYSPELFVETARLIPGSQLRVFDGRGHITVTMHPELAQTVTRFLAEDQRRAQDAGWIRNATSSR